MGAEPPHVLSALPHGASGWEQVLPELREADARSGHRRRPATVRPASLSDRRTPYECGCRAHDAAPPAARSAWAAGRRSVARAAADCGGAAGAAAGGWGRVLAAAPLPGADGLGCYGPAPRSERRAFH